VYYLVFEVNIRRRFKILISCEESYDFGTQKPCTTINSLAIIFVKLNGIGSLAAFLLLLF
jgi:hypothetical protein